MKKIFAFAAIALAAAACTLPGDKFEAGKEVLMMSGTGSTVLTKMSVYDNPPALYNVSVSATGLVSEDITVTLKFGDEDALAAYNESHGTDYQIVPSSAYTYDGDQVTIEAGTAVSAVNTISLNDLSFMTNGVQYMIPVSIASVSGGDLDVLESSRTLYIRLARTISFYALDVANSSLSSNFVFSDDQAIELSQYTYEIKCYPYNLKQEGADQICRLCNWTGANEERQCMLRFNENGRPWKSLQIVTPSGGDYTTTTIFEPQQWYMLSIVFDGSTFKLYINGEPDATTITGSEVTKFQRFEIGMSWQGYPSQQLFSGRICEVRVWNYARSKSQIKNGLCGVDAASEGLEAYWKFDEGSGHIFHDSTGNGMDMDWSQSRRDTGSGSLSPTPEAGTVAEGQWVKDDINTCTE